MEYTNVKYGDPVPFPANPTKDDYDFNGWVIYGNDSSPTYYNNSEFICNGYITRKKL